MMERQSCTWKWIAPLLVTLISISSPAQTKSRAKGSWLLGKITQLTLSQGFINLGENSGLQPGDTVMVRQPGGTWTPFTLQATSARTASFQISTEAQLPAEGAQIRARAKKPHAKKPPVTPSRPPKVELPPPEAVERLTSLWEGVDLRRVKLVNPPPHGGSASSIPSRSVNGSLRLDYLAQINMGSDEPQDYHRLSLSSTLEVPRLLTDWLSYSHRLRVSLHLSHDLDARPFQNSRPYLLVQELRLGLHFNRIEGEFGRTIGAPLSEASIIDGGAAQIRVTPWLYLGGFGGLLPRAEDLRPDTTGASFGAFASIRLAGEGQRDWSLAIDTGFIGSTWRGNTDRQALSARAQLEWSPLSLTAEAVVDLYGQNHLSGLSGADLSSLNVSLDAWLTRWLRCGGRFYRYRFVPSMESLEIFGGTYLDSEAVLSARGFLDLNLGAQTILGLQGGGDQQTSTGWAPWAELMLRVQGLIGEEDMLRLSAQVNGGTLLTGYGGRAAYFRPVASWLSLGGSYSLFGDTYRYQAETVWRHNFSISGEIPLGRHWLLLSEGQFLLSPEERILQVISSLAFYL